ncbi:hypothetical protein XA68_15888 [Ophiocordyceps unilateralis]|uniref:Uncharacterized protein n=1 Tax=Ophiocordyceps unilateralis TaxID=268505 RepID=A0A2A9PQ13_OPHUN|nr:hypothetical protein XA68_15888 [Ophiocordyceps unilateralis]
MFPRRVGFYLLSIAFILVLWSSKSHARPQIESAASDGLEGGPNQRQRVPPPYSEHRNFRAEAPPPYFPPRNPNDRHSPPPAYSRYSRPQAFHGRYPSPNAFPPPRYSRFPPSPRPQERGRVRNGRFRGPAPPRPDDPVYDDAGHDRGSAQENGAVRPEDVVYDDVGTARGSGQENGAVRPEDVVYDDVGTAGGSAQEKAETIPEDGLRESPIYDDVGQHGAPAQENAPARPENGYDDVGHARGPAQDSAVVLPEDHVYINVGRAGGSTTDNAARIPEDHVYSNVGQAGGSVSDNAQSIPEDRPQDNPIYDDVGHAGEPAQDSAGTRPRDDVYETLGDDDAAVARPEDHVYETLRDDEAVARPKDDVYETLRDDDAAARPKDHVYEVVKDDGAATRPKDDVHESPRRPGESAHDGATGRSAGRNNHGRPRPVNEDHIYEVLPGEREGHSHENGETAPEPPKRNKGMKVPFCKTGSAGPSKRTIEDCIWPEANDESSTLFDLLEDEAPVVDESSLSGRLEQLAEMAERNAEADFSDLVNKLEMQLPILEKNQWTLSQLRAQFKKLLPKQGIEDMLKSWEAEALIAVALPFYIADLVETFQKNTTDLERAATATMVVPLVGCAVRAAADADQDSLAPISTELCFVGDALLFTPLAFVGIFTVMIAPIIRALEQRSPDHVRGLRDREWKKQEAELLAHFKSTEWKTKFETWHSTQLAASLFIASEQRGLLKAIQNLSVEATEAERLNINRTVSHHLAVTEKAMCASMQARKRQYERTLPTGSWVYDRATNLTEEFIKQYEDAAWKYYHDFVSTRFFWTEAQRLSYGEPLRKELETMSRYLRSTALFAVDAVTIPETAKDFVTKALVLPPECDCPADAKESRETGFEQRPDTLLCATRKGYTDVVDQLLKAPYFDVNVQDKEGNTALSLAAAKGDFDILEMLLHRGRAKPRIPNKRGETAQSLAEAGGYQDIVHLLQTWGEAGVPCSYWDYGRKLQGHLEWQAGCFCTVTVQDWPDMDRFTGSGSRAIGRGNERDRDTCIQSEWRSGPHGERLTAR